jgi:hypothetical protein
VKNSGALKRLKFERAEGRAVSDDLGPQLRTVRHTACLVRIFGHFCIRLQNHVRLGNELSGRPRDCSTGAPTDPDVQDSRIRLFESSGC